MYREAALASSSICYYSINIDDDACAASLYKCDQQRLSVCFYLHTNLWPFFFHKVLVKNPSAFHTNDNTLLFYLKKKTYVFCNFNTSRCLLSIRFITLIQCLNILNIYFNYRHNASKMLMMIHRVNDM